MINFDNLPGTKGIRVPKRLSDKQMEYLTKQYGVEFAQVYELGVLSVLKTLIRQSNIPADNTVGIDILTQVRSEPGKRNMD